MKRITTWLSLILVAIFLLVACESNEEPQTKKEENSSVKTSQVEEERNIDSEKQDDEATPTDIQLSGEVVNENG